MVSKTVTIKNEQGLHMRPAGTLAKEMAKFSSDIQIVLADKDQRKECYEYHGSLHQRWYRNHI